MDSTNVARRDKVIVSHSKDFVDNRIAKLKAAISAANPADAGVLLQRLYKAYRERLRQRGCHE